MSEANKYMYLDGAVALGYLANHAARFFNGQVDAALRPHGLSLALIGPLLVLWWKGPMLQRDLVNASAIKQPAMVALLDKLEALRLVERATTATDRGAAAVCLTANGKMAAVRGRRLCSDAMRLGSQALRRKRRCSSSDCSSASS